MLFNLGRSKSPDNTQSADARPQKMKGGSDLIFDVTVNDFEARVMQASMQTPILLDFWAPWCGPCKQLTPALEKAVQQAGGAVRLAKVNIDENQQLAAALRVQSVPTVFAIFQGQPIDAFQGALPESQIKAFIDKAVQAAKNASPNALDIPEALKQAAELLAQNDLGAAQNLYAAILSQDDKNADAYVGLVRSYIAADMLDQAQHMLDGAPHEIKSAGSFGEAVTALELAQISPAGSLAELEKAVQQSPGDFQARLDLAMTQFSNNRKEQAIDTLIAMIAENRDWNDEAARKQLLKFFEALGHADPLTVAGRKKLSTVLFS